MNEIKKILLAAFSLFLIININQAIAADFSNEPQQILDAKSSLKLKSVSLAEKYPEYISIISTTNSLIDKINYINIVGDMKEITLALLPEGKEWNINRKIQDISDKEAAMRSTLESMKKVLVPIPEDLREFACSPAELYLYICALGKQEIAEMSSKKDKDSNSKQKL